MFERLPQKMHGVYTYDEIEIRLLFVTLLSIIYNVFMKNFRLKRTISIVCLCVFLLGCCASTPVERTLTLQGDHGRLAAVMHVSKKPCPLVIILHGFNASKDMPLLTELAS